MSIAKVISKFSQVSSDESMLEFRRGDIFNVVKKGEDDFQGYLFLEREDGGAAGWAKEKAFNYLDVEGNPITTPATDTEHCGGCGLKFENEYVQAFEGPGGCFHQACFTCCVCHGPVLETGFAPFEGNLFCPTCYYGEFSPKCGQCQEPITDAYIKAMGETFHQDHFMCTTCSSPFPNMEFYKYEGKPYCEEHFISQFATKCTKCSEVIDGLMFEVGDDSYHDTCFICAHPDDPHQITEGSEFHEMKGELFCASHFKDLVYDKCHRCSEHIDKEYASVDKLLYHYPDCFSCKDCGQVIGKASMFNIVNEELLCYTCDKNRKMTSGPSRATEVPSIESDETKKALNHSLLGHFGNVKGVEAVKFDVEDQQEQFEEKMYNDFETKTDVENDEQVKIENERAEKEIEALKAEIAAETKSEKQNIPTVDKRGLYTEEEIETMHVPYSSKVKRLARKLSILESQRKDRQSGARRPGPALPRMSIPLIQEETEKASGVIDNQIWGKRPSNSRITPRGSFTYDYSSNMIYLQ